MGKPESASRSIGCGLMVGYPQFIVTEILQAAFVAAQLKIRGRAARHQRWPFPRTLQVPADGRPVSVTAGCPTCEAH
jgi:hypothetical protein